MTSNSIHRAAMLAAIAGGMGAAGIDPSRMVRQRPPGTFDAEPRPPRIKRKTKGRRSNHPLRQSPAKKAKRIAKIARASRRYNLRTSA